TTAALFTLIVAIILTVPPLRAIAQDILRQIGIYNVTDAPTDAEIARNPLPSRSLLTVGDNTEIYEFNANEIAEISTFKFLSTLPDGYTAVEYNSIFDLETRFRYIQTRYEHANQADWFTFQTAFGYGPDSYAFEYETDA